MQTYEISLDMKKAPGRIERTVVVRRGDADTQTIEAAITAGGEPYTPKGAARLDIMHADGTWARCSASVSGSTAACTLPSEALNGTGRCRAAHFVFTDGGKVESTEGFALVIEDNVDANGTPGAQGYDSELEALKDAWRKFTERAERDEAARVSAESSRSAAETARAEAETARKAAQAKNNADQALNNEAMKKLSPVILQAGQYDPSTLTPTVTGEPNRVYFVPMVAPAAIELYDLTAKQVEAGNLYVEWMWVGGKWEQMGQSEMKAKPITTDQVDAVFAGTHPTGDSVLNLTGLDYVRTKDAELLDGKADASHTHTAGDIASGTLDPARVPVLPTAKVDGLQAALDGKQPRGEYAASSHTHAVAEVTGLQEALDGKAAASHRHAAADIDGLDAAVGGVVVVRTDKDYPDGWEDPNGFYVTLKDATDPLYPAYYASQAIVLFRSGLAMWKNGRISKSGAIFLSGPVRGCTARFTCSGSGSSGNGGMLNVHDGGLLFKYSSCYEATIDTMTIDGWDYKNVPLTDTESGPLGFFVEKSSFPQDWWAMTLALTSLSTGSEPGVTSLATWQTESGVYGVCYGNRGDLARPWDVKSRLSVRFVRER